MDEKKKLTFIYPTIEIIELNENDFIITESDPFPSEDPLEEPL